MNIKRLNKKYVSKNNPKSWSYYYLNKCDYCGKEFETLKKDAKTCSGSCKAYLINKIKKEKLGIKENEFLCNGCNRVLHKVNSYKNKYKCKFCERIEGIARTHGMLYSEIIDKIDFQNWKCSICGESMKLAYDNVNSILLKDFGESLSIDHKTPKSKGGENIKSNFGIAHQRCNAFKSNMGMDELIEWCKLVIKHNS